MEAMQHKKYTFKVMKSANKVEIAKAVEAMFPGTKVAAVNTMNCDGKLKRMAATRAAPPATRRRL